MGETPHPAGGEVQGKTLTEVFAEVCVILGKTPREVGELSIHQLREIHRANQRLEFERTERDAHAARAAQAEKNGFKEFLSSIKSAIRSTRK